MIRVQFGVVNVRIQKHQLNFNEDIIFQLIVSQSLLWSSSFLLVIMQLASTSNIIAKTNYILMHYHLISLVASSHLSVLRSACYSIILLSCTRMLTQMIMNNLPTDFKIVTANPRRDSTRRGLKFIFDHLGPAREKFNNIITHTIQVSIQLCHGLHVLNYHAVIICHHTLRLA